jgi:homoserine O-acetyltransferase
VDTNRFFIISPTALGSSGSASPCTTELGPAFPFYTVRDMVNFHMKLLESLGIKHLKGVIGTSMGGFQALQWATDYPDFMDFLIPIATGLKSGRQMNGAYGLMSRIIQEDPAYQGGNYDDNPIGALERGSTIGFLWSMTPEYFEQEFETDEDFWEAMDERNQEVAALDANDIIWRNQAMLNFNMEVDISDGNSSRIRAKTLVIGIEDDQIFPPSISTIPLAESIEDAEIFLYPSIFGHYGCVRDLEQAADAILSFLESNKMY